MIDRLIANPAATLAAVLMLGLCLVSVFKDIRLAVPRWFLSLLFLCVALYAANVAVGSPSIETLQGWMKR